MDTIKINKYNTKINAHRGLSGIEPENTLSAFDLAGKKSYFGIECDVSVSKDKKYFINHDDTLLRTYGIDKKIEEMTSDELKKLKNLANGAPVPQYYEYLTICKKYSKKAIVEIKGIFNDEELEGLVRETKNLNYLENTIFIAFDLINLINLRKILPNQKLEYLTSIYNKNILDALNRFNLDIDINHRFLTKEIIDEVHKNNHIVNSWTVDEKGEAEELAQMGIDLITTNILE